MTGTTDMTRCAPRPLGPGPTEECEAAENLAAARLRVDLELRAAVDSLPGWLRRTALHHFGREGADGTPAAGNAGKAARSALVLTAVRALGGDPLTAVGAAAAVELTHNSTLLHDTPLYDDVRDRDVTRRNRPAVWTAFGDADASLAGDALGRLAQRLLAEDPHPGAPAAAARLAACAVELRAGQRADRALEGRALEDVSLEECLGTAEAKTGALLGCACAIGAVYAGAGADTVAALDGFGRQAGLAFQLIDDVIGIWGDPARTGTPARSDLAVRGMSLPVLAALASGTFEGAALAGLYGRGREAFAGDPERVAQVVERAGGRDWAQSHAADRMSRALGELARAVPDPVRADGLLALTEYVTRRSY
ncbi:polyprenyl synthetase family protein [Streptomyces sp. NPDC017940]|uniref:polyprenyl synthetase family protein n=1 Tax=Streptomyces sp. NPDC017940 TaxID=3365017 RepID=UPI0037A2C63E